MKNFQAKKAADNRKLEAHKVELTSGWDEEEKELYWASIMKPRGDISRQRRRAALAWINLPVR